MLIRSLFIVLFCLLITPSVVGQLRHDEKVDTILPIFNKIPKKPWTAAGEIMIMNILINRLDANIRNVYWAKVTPTTWKNNLKIGFQTDWDHFTTNWLGHPVHGSLFFNAARSNGYNYWGSLPFTVGGSLVWEYFGETQYASEIDLFTTTMGGMYVGELTHRLTDLFKRKISNKNKLLKNVAITALNPMGKLNSVLNKNYDGYNNYTPNVDLKYQFMFGSAYSLGKIGDDIKGFKGFVNLSMIYGDIFNHVSKPYNPFDFFILRTWLDFN
ncbi:MAG TPA: DUF3943 domain-containing protein, partial [Allocoleopsis sp.]